MTTPRGSQSSINIGDDSDRPADTRDEEVGRSAAVDMEHVGAQPLTDDEIREKMATFLQSQIDDDEGCIIDITEDGNYGKYFLTEDHLPPAKLRGFNCPPFRDDSGFSSRVSEDSASLHRAVEIAELTKAVAVVAQTDETSDDKADDETNAGSGGCQVRNVLKGLLKFAGVLLLLYTFICSLDLLSNAFRLLGGKTAGSVFQDSQLLQNPITGLMIGVIATVILQSSSTSSSIVITMVSSGILEVRPAIPVVMGANIGTTVTNTLVSLAHSTDAREFRRAFSGATVHDVFNWLTVLILLPVEHFSGYLFHLTQHIVQGLNIEELQREKRDLLKQLTKPLTKRIVQVDKKVIMAIAENKADPDARLLKIFCGFNTTETVVAVNKTLADGNVTLVNETQTLKVPTEECNTLINLLGLGDTESGVVLFVASLSLLSLCLYLMVKLLHSLLGSRVLSVAKKTINANFPGRLAFLTDYFALLVGAGMTILVQSSSVFTSALTPLVGVGCLKLERMYPLTLGSNVGTTGTGILAALAASPATMRFALQLALCHLFFNITGILLFFPIPALRRIPLRTAKFLGRTTARYRWFAVFYLLLMFVVFPGCFLALSFAGEVVFIVVVSAVGLVALLVLVTNVLQRSRFRTCLPVALRTWQWLPLCLRSLQPLDSFFRSLCTPCQRICCQCCLARCQCLQGESSDDVDSDSESDDVSDRTSESRDSVSLHCSEPQRLLQGQQPTDTQTAAERRQIGVWQKRTSSPIYKPSAKPLTKCSYSTVPLLQIRESII